MHLLQPVAHQLERFAKAFFECALQFFVDGGPHLVDLFRVVLLQLSQSNVDSRSHTFERPGQFFPLIFRGRACFLAIAGKFIAQAAIDHFQSSEDRKSTRLNSSHQIISYAVFCLKKKNEKYMVDDPANSSPVCKWDGIALLAPPSYLSRSSEVVTAIQQNVAVPLIVVSRPAFLLP